MIDCSIVRVHQHFNSSLVCSAAVQEPGDGGPYVRPDLLRSWRLAQTKQALQMEGAQQHAPELVCRLLRVLEAQGSAAGLLFEIFRKQRARMAWPHLPVPLRQLLHGDTLGHNEPVNPEGVRRCHPQASTNTLTQQIAQQKLVIEQDRQQVVSDRAALVFSQQDFQRYTQLAKTGYGTVQRAQQAQADITEKQAALQHDTTVVAAAEKQIDVFEGQLAQANATLAQQQAMEHQAELNLSYTTITAPVDGTVGVRTLRVGEYVQAGTQLMAIAPLQAVYVVANYKETQLTDVRPGQAVTIDIDTFPGITVHGHVDSLAPASGQEFALLPPDNATGNFTKIVQRIPVKIDIDKNEPLLGRLRPGMSVEPTIDTRPISAAPSSGRAP
jgi:multidrug resistance efflux pump